MKASAPSPAVEAEAAAGFEAGLAAGIVSGNDAAPASFNANVSQAWSVVIFLPSASMQVLMTLADARLEMPSRKIDIEIFISVILPPGMKENQILPIWN
ncbi:MAG: hypothetical protein V4634_16955 [Pseudomonadota bacterium]